MGDVAQLATEEFDPAIPNILPHDKVYSIQVGYRLFRLSGASLSSDAPSYFTKFFATDDNADKVLFIDRNPVTFEKIYNHLQGYHINVDTDTDYVYLWADSFYFGLKRLQRLLNTEYIFCTVGSTSFKFPRELLAAPGNTPNYFSINVDSQLTDNRRIIEANNILRPPPQRPPTIAGRSPQLFADLLEVLRGNHLVIRDDDHRRLLAKECRYYRFLELEQRIVKHKVVNSPTYTCEEVLLNLNDISAKGVKPFQTEGEAPLMYARPYIKEPHRILMVQILNEGPFQDIKLIVDKTNHIAFLQLVGKIRQKFILVFQKYSREFREDSVNDKIRLVCGLKNSKATINGLELKPDWYVNFLGMDEEPPAKKQTLNDRQPGSPGALVEMTLTKSIWRVVTLKDHGRVHCVALEGFTDRVAYVRDKLDFL